MNIKKGDNVIILAGKDKGKKGTVTLAMPAKDRVVVEGINMVKRHQKPTRSGQKGQTVSMAMPMHVSNVALVDPQKGTATRIGKKMVGDKMVRVTKKSGAEMN